MTEIKPGFPEPNRIRGLPRALLDESTEKAGFDLERGRCVLVGEGGEPVYGYRGDDSEAEEILSQKL